MVRPNGLGKDSGGDSKDSRRSGGVQLHMCAGLAVGSRAVSLSELLAEQPGNLPVTSLSVSNVPDRLVPG